MIFSNEFVSRQRANGRNNSQQCCANNVGSCLRSCWQWCANGCNNSQQCWDLQCIVGRIQPISLCKPCVMSVRGPNNVGRAVQTDPTLLRYALAITERKKCWELLAEKFDWFQTFRAEQRATTSNNMQQSVQTDATCNIQQCWELFVNNVASICTQPKAHAHYARFTKNYGLHPSHDALQVPTLLGVVASVSTPPPTCTQQLPTLLAQQVGSCFFRLHAA